MHFSVNLWIKIPYPYFKLTISIILTTSFPYYYRKDKWSNTWYPLTHLAPPPRAEMNSLISSL